MALPLVALIAYPDFSLFHFSVPQIIFGHDILPEQHLFDLKTVSPNPDGDLHCRGHGMQILADGTLALLAAADIVIVPGWPDVDEAPSPELLAALQAAYRRGAYMVGLCLGTYVLAHAGLLDGRRAATHWEAEADFSARFPNVALDNNALYIHDGRVITSAGTAASLDCCLYIVREFYGVQTANKIARRMVVPPHREGGQAQFIEQPLPQSTQNAHINRLLDFLRTHLHQPHSLDDLAGRAAMSRRTFTRHFQKATGLSVGEWLLQERLRRSCELLEATSLPVEKIAEMAGFSHAVSLRKHFRERFKVTPSAWRRQFGAS
ncbi:helix-turn-helix domain-containing protein [Uruburuella testudinis]|uniref:Helix-turn-helix domain-containing protein n=1 Tax=Uruburuella testudinis TaxID=1282863 RepID=A0ABY4E182_9NEIS|nr:helix-turn-helix domain-containing protein [Uruburuella testudinis]UOO82731.1 helix-turn-helix domain-containing protein [Uruburuella testudinis]